MQLSCDYRDAENSIGMARASRLASSFLRFNKKFGWIETGTVRKADSSQQVSRCSLLAAC